MAVKVLKGQFTIHQTGEKITKFNKKQKVEIAKLVEYGRTSLHYSDLLNNHNLLRFYTPAGFIPTNPNEFDYKINYQKMLQLRKELGNKSTSLYSQHKGTTTDLYTTDASEIDKDEINNIPENIQSATSEKIKIIKTVLQEKIISINRKRVVLIFLSTTLFVSL